MPHCRMRNDASPRGRTKRRQVAECTKAMELAGPPAEETTEETMTIVDSVACEPIDYHKAEEFVAQDVVGE